KAPASRVGLSSSTTSTHSAGMTALHPWSGCQAVAAGGWPSWPGRGGPPAGPPGPASPAPAGGHGPPAPASPPPPHAPPPPPRRPAGTMGEPPLPALLDCAFALRATERLHMSAERVRAELAELLAATGGRVAETRLLLDARGREGARPPAGLR